MTLRKVCHWGGLFSDVLVAVECPAKSIMLVPCENAVAARLVAAHHYSGTACSNTAVSLMVLWHGKPHGALQLGYGIRPDKNGGKGTDHYEFDRMWLSDDMPKFSESIVLGLLHLYIRNAYPGINYIVSYADMSAGNVGTIYKAANYRLVGEIPVDFYQLLDGTRVHPVTMWHRHKTRAWGVLQRLYPGIRHIKGDGLCHQKYVFDLVR